MVDKIAISLFCCCIFCDSEQLVCAQKLSRPQKLSGTQLSKQTTDKPDTATLLTIPALHRTMSSSSSSSSTTPINTYCVAHGLQSAAGKRYNGEECFVIKKDEAADSRYACLFAMDVQNGSSGLVSLKPENLKLKYHVEVKPSIVCPAAIGKGLFATKDFKRGEIIMDELPIFIYKAADLERKNGGQAIYNELRKTPAPLRDVLMCLRRVCPKELEEKAAKLNKSKEGAEAWLYTRLNGINSVGSGQGCVYALLSRMFHQCCVKSTHNTWLGYGGPEQGMRIVTAARDIEKGEELCYDYMDTVFNPAKRREELGSQQWAVVGDIDGGKGGKNNNNDDDDDNAETEDGVEGCDCSLCADDTDSAVGQLIKGYNEALEVLRNFGEATVRSNKSIPEMLEAVKAAYEYAVGCYLAVLQQIDGGKEGEHSAFIRTNMFTPITTAQLNALVSLLPKVMRGTAANKAAVKKAVMAALKVRYDAFAGHVGNNKTHPFSIHEKDSYESNVERFEMMLS